MIEQIKTWLERSARFHAEGGQAKRLAVCRDCEFFRQDLTVPRCAKCQCFLALKTELISARCPLGKW